MERRNRGVIASRTAALGAFALACSAGMAIGADAGPNARALPGLAPDAATAIETVRFADPQRPPVQVVRGPQLPPPRSARPAAMPPARRPEPAARPISTQLVTFGSGVNNGVTVVRGTTAIPASLVRRIDPARPARMETVSFANPLLPAVTVLRGPGVRDWFSVDLFGPPDGGVLGRIAFAVEGVESRHGADLRMWRPEIDGPQGPMQVSLAAALDVGGGNRFDMRENRLLGAAYLAQMFQRYGNWPDALAAYNWGPGNMDLWIAGGRRADRLPFETARYVDLVLRNVFLSNTTAAR
jgi:soluble lytic murein transglycosylase-like protein